MTQEERAMLCRVIAALESVLQGRFGAVGDDADYLRGLIGEVKRMAVKP
jgi:hypothetical protein